MTVTKTKFLSTLHSSRRNTTNTHVRNSEDGAEGNSVVEYMFSMPWVQSSLPPLKKGAEKSF
jgi:hypothetical protein